MDESYIRRKKLLEERQRTATSKKEVSASSPSAWPDRQA
jgi:hypothetical protein